MKKSGNKKGNNLKVTPDSVDDESIWVYIGDFKINIETVTK